MPDTPQQKKALRTNRVARKVRAEFPEGTRVEGTTGKGGTGHFGTVKRHVPALTALGGALVVEWDNGSTGSVTPTSLRKAS